MIDLSLLLLGVVWRPNTSDGSRPAQMTENVTPSETLLAVTRDRNG